MMMDWYAGVGSRSTPANVCRYFTHIAAELERDGFGLQSGGAEGADLAFEDGVVDSANARIFIPWPTFGRGLSTNRVLAGEILDRCVLLASVVHPAWGACKSAPRLLHARNVAQIWGPNLMSPVKFVLCWTEERDGEVMGGKRTAVVLARAAGIPVFNFAVPGTRARFDAFRNALRAADDSPPMPRRLATAALVRSPRRELLMTFKSNTESGIRPHIVADECSILRSLPWGGRQYLSMGIRKWSGGFEAVHLHPKTLEPLDDEQLAVLRFEQLTDTLAWIRYQTSVTRKFFWNDEPVPIRPVCEPMRRADAAPPLPKPSNR